MVLPSCMVHLLVEMGMFALSESLSFVPILSLSSLVLLAAAGS